MPRTSGPRPLELCGVLLLAAVSAWATYDHQKDDSPTMDEPYHTMAGAEYVRNGTYGLNLEHPPLVKLLAGAALGPLSLAAPSPGARIPSSRPDFLNWVYGNTAPAHVIVEHARRPMPLLLVATVLTVYAVARAAFGGPAGLLAAGLVALDPNMVAHAGLVHTDVAAALLVTATLGVALLALKRGPAVLWALSGVLLGLALAAKFSAVLLIPLLLLSPLLVVRGERAGLRRAVTGSWAAVAVGGAVLLSTYTFCMRRMAPEEAADAAMAFLRSRGASGPMLERQQTLSLISPAAGHYAAGLAGVRMLDAGGRGANYLMGRVSTSSFPGYFFVAFLVKSTPAVLALTLLLALLGRRELLSFWYLGLLLPAVVFFAAAARSHFNIGLRHILPVYPLLAIAGAGILARRLTQRAFLVTAAVLVASSGASLALSHPGELAYFNVLAGGPEKRAYWLTDSNLDWGQDMKRLARTLEARGWMESTTIVAYSGLAVNYYLPRCQVLDSAQPIQPGRYAVSALMEAIGPEFVRGLEGEVAGEQVRTLLEKLRRSGRRLGRVGGSITIWELPPG